MPVSIPTKDLPFFQQVTNLDGTDYLLSFRYNQREARYSLSIATPDGVDIATGAKLVCTFPLFANQRKTEALPPGVLAVIFNGADDTPPTVGELGPGKRCELYYYSLEELAALK